MITDSGKTFKDRRLLILNKQQFDKTGKNYLYSVKIEGNKFKFYRIIGGEDGNITHNSFNPFCIGKIRSTDEGCTVKLTFRSAIFVLVFMTFWTSGVLLATVTIFFGSLSEEKYQDALITPFALSPFYIGFWLFYKFGFKREVDTALRFLNTIKLTPNGSR